jgi:hypothetical protein
MRHILILVEKPTHQQAEDLSNPKDTSKGICMYV